MDQRRPVRPSRSIAVPRDVQPHNTADPEVTRCLDDPELAEANRRLARLKADAELVLELQLSNYDKAVWDPIAAEFARYGIAVLQSWMRSHTILGRVRAKTGNGLPPTHEDWFTDYQVTYDLAVDVVLDALDHFLDDVLKKNRWDPTRRASLKTYFVGQCLIRFPNPYRSHWRAERDRRQQETSTSDSLILDRAAPAADDAFLARRRVEDALAISGRKTEQQVFLLREAGYTAAEIAMKLGMGSERVVHNLIAYRRKLAVRGDRRTS